MINEESGKKYFRFYLALMLRALLTVGSVWEVSENFVSPRGDVENLHSSTHRFAVCVNQFVQEFDELTVFTSLLRPLINQLYFCCSKELIPFLSLPNIDKRRAKLFRKKGFKSLDDIANCSNMDDLRDFLQNQCQLSKSSVLHLIHAAKQITEKSSVDDIAFSTNLYTNRNFLLNESFESDISDVSFIDN